MSDSNATPPLLIPRLSAMMFLQYAAWGAWLPILFPFLLGHRQFDLPQVGNILAIGAVGAIIGPFIAGQVADRYFSTERFLAFSHLLGAVLIWKLAQASDYTTFFWMSLLYGMVYAPTLALTNSISFAHLPDRNRDFGRVRLWGTIGWIVAGIAIGHWLLYKHTPTGASEELIKAAQDAGRADAFRLSAILGGLLGLYSFTLPHTPPPGKQDSENAISKSLTQIARQPLVTLFLLAVPISCIHQFYFVYTSEFLSNYGRETANKINAIFGVGGGGLMTIGQMSEILVLAAMPFVARSLSRKTLLAIGILAYAGRMALFAYTDTLPTLLLGVALHGLCFGCFIFVAFMVVDEETSHDVRASAQNLFNLVIVGVGIIVGSKVATSVGAWATDKAGANDTPEYWRALFSAPFFASLACLVALLLLYPNRSARLGDRAA